MQKISKFTLKLWHSGPTALGWMQVFKTEGARERERNRNTKRKRKRERERENLWIIWTVNCEIVKRREHKTRNR